MSWTTERARVAALSRSREHDDPDLEAARRNLRAAVLSEHIQKSLAEKPPFTEDQLRELAAQLRPSGGASVAA